MRSASDSSGTSIGSLSAIEIAVPPWSTLLKLPLVTPLLGLETSVPNPGGVKQVSGDGNALDQPARAFTPTTVDMIGLAALNIEKRFSIQLCWVCY